VKPKLLLISSGTSHAYNFYKLIAPYFSEIKVITNKKNKDWDFDAVELDFSLKNISAYFKTPSQIRKIAEEFKPDVIHIHQANSYAFYVLRGLKNYQAPKIVTAWGSDILLSPGKSFWLKKMVQYNLKNADAFTSDSKFMAEEMQRLAPERKLDILIANFGIGIEPVAAEKENVIYSNRLHKKLYRIDAVIRAFSKFSEKQNWRLVIAATGEETEQLKSLAKQLNVKAEFVGWVDKNVNAQWYSKAKIFVSVPESDATAISLLEAMACGCIPVVSDLPANREWINDGENGIIVSNLEEDFYSQALKINSAKAIEQNKKLIAEHGTKQVNSEKFMALYNKLLKI
jgi:glycosyltransferase involved in cell wall biosynthesis